MSQDVFFTREPVINKQRAITATRLRVHAPTCGDAVAALDAIGEDWPPARPVFVSLAGCAPDASLADWIAPEGAMMEVGAVQLAGGDGELRIRVGDYRIIYDVEDDALVVLVLRIGHRGDVYK